MCARPKRSGTGKHKERQNDRHWCNDLCGDLRDAVEQTQGKQFDDDRREHTTKKSRKTKQNKSSSSKEYALKRIQKRNKGSKEAKASDSVEDMSCRQLKPEPRRKFDTTHAATDRSSAHKTNREAHAKNQRSRSRINKSKSVDRSGGEPVFRGKRQSSFTGRSLTEKEFIELAQSVIDYFCRRYVLSEEERETLLSKCVELYPDFQNRQNDTGKPPYFQVENFLKRSLPELYANKERREGSLLLSGEELVASEVKERVHRIRAEMKQCRLSGCFTEGHEDCDLFINIGLDFGTSSVKAVYRDMDSGQSFPVRFGETGRWTDFLFTDQLSVEKGDLVFVRDSEEGVSLKKAMAFVYASDLNWTETKMRLQSVRSKVVNACPRADNMSDRALVEFLVSIYLTLVLWRVRQFVGKDLRARGYEEEPGFSVCMCVPVEFFRSGDYVSNPVCFGNYAALAAADQLFSLIPERCYKTQQISVEEALGYWEEVMNLGAIVDFGEASPLRLCPEVSAEAASYWLSKAAVRGLYLLVDIGAGTADISFFRYSDSLGERSAKAPVFEASCSSMGVEELEQQLLAIVRNDLKPEFLRSLRDQRTGANSKRLGYFPSFDGSEERYSTECERTLESYVRAVGSEVWSVCGHASKKLLSGTHDITVFLGGGGKSVRRMDELGACFRSHPVISRCEIRDLPVPEDFASGECDIPFHRVAVAYGLSLLADPQALPNDIRVPYSLDDTHEDYRDRYISKDMV